jgi:hypothetical protein
MCTRQLATSLGGWPRHKQQQRQPPPLGGPLPGRAMQGEEEYYCISSSSSDGLDPCINAFECSCVDMTHIQVCVHGTHKQQALGASTQQNNAPLGESLHESLHERACNTRDTQGKPHTALPHPAPNNHRSQQQQQLCIRAGGTNCCATPAECSALLACWPYCCAGCVRCKMVQETSKSVPPCSQFGMPRKKTPNSGSRVGVGLDEPTRLPQEPRQSSNARDTNLPNDKFVNLKNNWAATQAPLLSFRGGRGLGGSDTAKHKQGSARLGIPHRRGWQVMAMYRQATHEQQSPAHLQPPPLAHACRDTHTCRTARHVHACNRSWTHSKQYPACALQCGGRSTTATQKEWVCLPA